MPHKDPEVRKAYLEKWRKEHPDVIAIHAQKRKERWPESEERLRHNARTLKRHHDYVNENNRTQRRNWKIQAFDYFGWECFDCGEVDIDVIEFDHVRGIKIKNPCAFTNETAYFNEVTEKCEPVCANCHRKRTLTRKRIQRTGIPLAN